MVLEICQSEIIHQFNSTPQIDQHVTRFTLLINFRVILESHQKDQFLLSHFEETQSHDMKIFQRPHHLHFSSPHFITQFQLDFKMCHYYHFLNFFLFHYCHYFHYFHYFLGYFVICCRYHR